MAVEWERAWPATAAGKAVEDIGTGEWKAERS